MKRVTLLDRCSAILQARTDAAIQIALEHFGSIPATLFTVGDFGNDHAPHANEVERIDANFVRGAWFDKKPTRKTLEALEAAEPVTAATSLVFMKHRSSYGTISFAKKVSEFGVEFFLSPEPAAVIGDQRREFFTVKPGQFKCAQCGKATDDADKVTRRIIARQYPGFGKEFDHCSAQCALHNQFAHEG